MKSKSIFSLLGILAIVSCKTNPPKYIYNDGIIHGAPYHIVYESPEAFDFHAEIESVSGYGYRLSNKKKSKEN